jgi:hypothetical protein
MPLYPHLIRWFYNLSSKLLFFIQIQLFMMLVSLPILVAWGLPFSMMSLVGNLIFAPFLIIFLLISCLIFFFELCCLPNNFLITCLEKVTQVWSWCAAQGTSAWLMGFKKPPIWFLWALIIGLLYILHHRKLQNPKRRIVALMLFLGFIIVTLKVYGIQNVAIKEVACALGSVTVLKAGSSLSVIDYGAMGKRPAPQWVEYTLVKEVVEQFGSLNIDQLILTRPTTLSLEYAARICSLMNVSKVYLVTWRGESKKRQLQAYGRLRSILSQKKGTMIRIAKDPLSLNLAKRYTLIIEPQQEQLTVQQCTFSKVGIRLVEGSATQLLDVKSC